MNETATWMSRRAKLGTREPGGCDRCAAYNTVTYTEFPDVFRMIVHHDDRCPEWRRIQRQAA